MEHIDFIHGKTKSAIIQLLTLGGLGIWTIIDLIIIASQKFTDFKGDEIKVNNKKHLNIISVICVMILLFDVCIFVMVLSNIENLKLDLLHIKNDELSVYIDYNDFIDDINLNKGMQIFMEYNATDKEEKQLKSDLNEIQGIDNIEYISKEMAYQEMKEKLGEESSVMEGFDYSIFPASYKITVSNLSENDEIYNKVIVLDNVREVRNDYEKASYYTNIKRNIDFKVISVIILIIIHTSFVVLTEYTIIRKKKSLQIKGVDYNAL